jgi:hypothetical protein
MYVSGWRAMISEEIEENIVTKKGKQWSVKRVKKTLCLRRERAMTGEESEKKIFLKRESSQQ